MFKSFKKISSVYLILTIIFSIVSFYQLTRPGFFPMQDDLQAFRVEQMVKCVKDFQIPCRWIPDMGYQYGYVDAAVPAVDAHRSGGTSRHHAGTKSRARPRY